ncbi:hypothetical protein ACFVAF_36815 [Streptomyces sp. NPDC057596]|uniref:hypothetical protein n=1 Tax=Streptomyces sp. NPDC057596 TaxID=3346178 RepID=UPI0036A5CEBA
MVTAGTGLQVNIRANTEASVRGHAWTSGTSTVSLAVGSNSSGQTRTDRVVLRLDRSTWTVRAVVKAGTPGSGAPALTQQTGDTGVYEIPLARATILTGASAVSVTREELYTGSRVRPCTSSTRNPNPVVGEMGMETDTGRLVLWDGSAWRIVYGTGSQATADASVSAWTRRGSSVVARTGSVVSLRTGYFDRTSALAAPSESRLPILIPADYQPPSLYQYATVYLSGSEIGNVTIYPKGDARAGQVWLTQHPAMSTGDTVLAITINWTV